MIRALATLLALTLPAGAATPFEPCPAITAGWSVGYQGPITTVMYDQYSLFMYVVWGYTEAEAFMNVPVSVMQSMSHTSTPVNIYNSVLVPQYHKTMLSEKDNCPIQFETGAYIWVD